MMMHAGDSGDANSTSMVPVSFSRTMATLLIITQTSIKTMPITPGTKLYSLFCCGLYSIRVTGRMSMTA